MPSVRGPPPSLSRNDCSIYLRARVYPGGQNNAVWCPVPTQVPPNRHSRTKNSSRYPWVEGLFQNRTLQPFIHDTHIVLYENGQSHQFHLFCQNHCRLPANAALNGQWRGEIIVMRIGINGTVVNAQVADAARIAIVVDRFIQRIHQETPFRLPGKLVFNA